MKNNPKVSILCLTYNHEKFIAQALDSFFMQKTNFDFEILIHDDASTDDTVKIIKKYQKKHPGKIKTLIQKENQYSKGKRSFIVRYLLPKAKGKYISLCEGDDFFNDENKLQLQVNFLDKNPEYSICFHQINIFFENKEEKDLVYPIIKNKSKLSVEELLKDNYIPNNSIMFKKQKSYKNISTDIFPGDWFLHLFHAQFGKIGFIEKVMSSYRRHSSGIYWNSYKDPDLLLKKHNIEKLRMFFELLKIYSKKKEYKKIIFDHINSILDKITKIDSLDNKSKLLENCFKIFPLELSNYFSSLKLSEVYQISENRNLEISHLQSKIDSLILELSEVNNNFNKIIGSKKWKIINKVDNLTPKLIKNILKNKNQ